MYYQKGLAFIPLLIWSFVGVGLITATTVGVAVIRSKVTPEQAIHDGSRTGERVGYQSYCNPEQGVVVYENEKMPFTTDEGEQVLWTQGDIDCYKERRLTAQITPTLPPRPQAPAKVQQRASNDGSRTGRIVPYKEYCSGNQISVYENEILTKISQFDGKTYSMTQGDWDCYSKNSQRKTTNTNSSTYPPCTVNYKYSGESKTYNYMTPEQCSYWQQKASTVYTPPANLGQLNYTPAPLPTYPPYQPSQEYLDSLERANKTFSEPWKPSQFTAPTQKCYATWDEYFNAHPNYAPQNIKYVGGTPPCD